MREHQVVSQLLDPQVQRRTILVADLVESVRMMNTDEAGTVAAWRGFLNQVQADLLPSCEGVLIKSLGDGLMATFASPNKAVRAALQMHALMHAVNGPRQGAVPLWLRIGVHTGDVLVDNLDIYGNEANIAARIASLGQPGDTLVSAPVRDKLVDKFDGRIVDLGERYVKHISVPLHVFRVNPLNEESRRHPETTVRQKPCIAVLPFQSRSKADVSWSLGELLADALHAQLCQSQLLDVVSRFSMAGFSSLGPSLGDVSALLGAQYAVTGSYVSLGTDEQAPLFVQAELVNCDSQLVVWHDKVRLTAMDLLMDDCAPIAEWAMRCHERIFAVSLDRVQQQSLQSIPSYELELGGIHLLHSSANSRFQYAHDVLSLLTDHQNRRAEPWVWLAKWHVMRVIKGQSDDPGLDAGMALSHSERALENYPAHSTAHAIKGYVLCQTFDDQVRSSDALNTAVELNPNDALAWLYKSVYEQHCGDVRLAVDHALRAKNLSPLDPFAYFQDVVLASAFLFADELTRACEVAHVCLDRNHEHLPALRVLLTAHVELGQPAAALDTLERIRLVSPEFSLANYRRMGNSNSRARQRVIRALQELGVD